jgi:Uma2 family endonuclease
MIATPNHRPMSPQEYLAWEEEQPLKYEYIHGEAYAMTGGTLSHNSIAVNITTALRTHLRGKGCKVFMADAKVSVSEQGPYFYPDVVVSCEERDRRALQMVQYPCLIIEVLSPGTEGYDRGDKFKFYRRLKTLQEYVLVDAEKLSVECYRLNERGKWELTAYPLDDLSLDKQNIDVQFTSIDFQCPIALIYEDIELGDSSAQTQ